MTRGSLGMTRGSLGMTGRDGPHHPLQNLEVEVVTVVRDDDILYTEDAKGRPHVLEVRRRFDILRAPAVRVARCRGDRDAGPHHRVKSIDDLAVTHPHCRDLDD